MRIRVLPYQHFSKSAKSLSRALGGLRIKLNNSRFVPRSSDVIINWGNSKCTYEYAINKDISSVVNKLTFMRKMKESGCEDVVPMFWENKDDIPPECFPIVARTVLNGHSGTGIVIANTPEELPYASLYTQYIKRKDEYRVHIFNGKIGFVQKKKRRLSHDNPNWQIRNHSNGFIYSRQYDDTPVSVTDVARTAFDASGLDFGAVDVIWNEARARAYVLEINTAPGLEGQTLEEYQEYIQEEFIR